MRQHINSWTYRLGISLLILAILAAAIPPRPASALGNRYYVRINGGSDANSGLSWNQAFKNLQKALSVAGTGDTIWVAKGGLLSRRGRQLCGRRSQRQLLHAGR